MDGATALGDTTDFRVWAPAARAITLHLARRSRKDEERLPMRRADDGYFTLSAPARAGGLYRYQVDSHQPVPDPVSRLLPEGVHGCTEIVDPAAFTWSDQHWIGVPWEDAIIYELHVGTFTPAGTFDAAIERLDYLKNTLGVTFIELMPVAAFPGERNWGYDGVSPYAVQSTYGGPDGLKRLVDAAHRIGFGVMLDVVYNHLGNEGNYLRLFGPYFTTRHKTPWGDAINYDDAGSDGVRRYVIENALYWTREYHLDGLRLDAVQTIYDQSPRHVVHELHQQVQALARQLGRQVAVVAETDQNLAHMVQPEGMGGWGLHGVWSDDFHHALHALLTGERQGYYQDFGAPQQVVRALEEGFVFQGEHFNYWNAPRGTPAAGVPAGAHVICTQNHDQVGNRATGDRLTALVPFGARKLAAALLLLAPQTPLLFMGQEYDEPAPFQFFTSYGDPALRQAVREGRRREFESFAWSEVPDPEDPQTFARSRLDWSLASPSNPMLAWYRQLIALRRRFWAGLPAAERRCRAHYENGVLAVDAPRFSLQCALQPAATQSRTSTATPLLQSDDDGYWLRLYER